MKKTVKQFTWFVIFWALGVGGLLLIASLIRFAMTLAGMESK